VNWDDRGCGIIPVKRGITMTWKDFFMEEEDGTLSTEMVVLIAAIGIILTVGVSALFTGMSGYFQSWADFFSSGG
jgi:Flp pilus assembly pilin Flp